MKRRSAGKLLKAVRSTGPVVLTLFFIFPFSLPLQISHLGLVATVVAMTSVYYWSIYRPELMPVGAVFLIGVFHDLLGGGPLGSMALTLLVLHLAALSQRRALAGKSSWIIWFGFCVIAAGTLALFWLMIMLFHQRLLHPEPLLVQYVLAVILYPLVAELFNGARISFLKV